DHPQPGDQPAAPGRPQEHRQSQPPPRPRPPANPQATSNRMNPTLPGPWPGRVIAVTGAGTGIGRAAARAFAAEGASVLAIGRRPGPLRETAAGHERITPLAADVTGTGEPERITRAARDLHGRLDVLVNNAGIVRGGTLGTLSHDAIAAQLAT